MDEPSLTTKNIADHAQQIPDAEERRAYLDRACENNPELRQRVEELLSDQPVPTLNTSDVPPGRWFDPKALPATLPEGVGSRIGPYKLLQQIGEGGMGAVFMAEQQEPVRRMVALKVIKAGLDSAQVIARFEAERQALALMDHPNIAKVLDAGTTSSGRPFFVMELVKGIPITKYCDEQRLTLQQRLELFVPVCQAIQHAHQKGIIHRDIKPSNVLVASYDGRPAPKVIDFGVAKAMGQKLTERTLFTGFGGIVGTLEYMSPEQAEFNALDIDTRSDVYSLGVLLYELLTGTTPLTRQRLKDAALMEVLRLIREEEPPRPSTRLSETKDSLASVSAQRHMGPSALLKAVRGEVDWVVMKALEKDRTRRYETANALARDIQRYLAEEPVEAGPPTAMYRLRKLAWKYRRGLTTAAALLLLLIASVVVSSSLAVWASHAEKQARTAEQEAFDERNRALTAEAEAKDQRDKAVAAEQATKRSEEDTKAVLGFFQDKVLSAGRPEGQEGGLGNKVTLRKAVDAAEPEIAKSFADRPLVEASIRSTLGTTYWHLGEYPQAIRQHERALALWTDKLGSGHYDTLAACNNLAEAYRSAGRLTDAILLFEQTFKKVEAKLGPDDPSTLTSHYNLISAYRAAGRTAEAIRLHEQILKQRESKFGLDHPDTLSSRNGLASAYQDAGRITDAIRLYEQTLKQREAKLGLEHPDTLTSRGNLANIYRVAGRLTDAIQLDEQTLKQREAKLGLEHPDTLASRNNLAEIYRAAGRITDAISLLEPTVKKCEAKLGPDHYLTIYCRNNLAAAYVSSGRAVESLPLFEQNLKQLEANLRPSHFDILTTRNNLAEVYRAVGRTAEAILLHERTLRQTEAKLGAGHPLTLTCCNNLALAYDAVGRTDEAIHLHEQTLKQREAKLGGDHPHTLQSRNNLAAAYDRAKEFAKAESLYRASLEQTRKRFGAEDTATAGRMASLGTNLLYQHKYADAEPLLRDCLKIREAKQPDSWTTFNTRSQLGGALLGRKKYADAESLLLSGYQGMKQREKTIPPQGKIRLSEALERLVQLYEATGKKDEADKWRKLQEQTRKTKTKNADKK